MSQSAERIMPDLCNRRNPIHFSTALNLLRISGVDLDRVNILAIGEYENYKGEVLHQEPSPGAVVGPTTRITLKVGYFSAVDRMPYQFFFGLFGRPAGKNWEMNARNLVAPFDASRIRHEATARFLELKYCNFGIDPEHLSRYLGLFDFVPADWELEQSEAYVWACLLPAFYDWAGNPERVAALLQFFLGYPCRIVENIPAEFPIGPEIQYHLGSLSGRMGHETVMGRAFTECDSTYHVIVSGVRHEEVVQFLPGGKKRKRLEWLLDKTMPGHLTRMMTIETDSKAMVLGKADQGGYLGYSTCL